MSLDSATIISILAVLISFVSFYTKQSDKLAKQEDMLELKARVGRLEIQREEFIRLETKVDGIIEALAELKNRSRV